MLTPPTTVPVNAQAAAHAFDAALLICMAAGFVVLLGLVRRPARRRHRLVAPVHAWKVDGEVNRELYYASGRWAAKRRRLKRKTGYFCKWPGCRATTHLHCHHMGREVYNHLGDERMDEIVWLCSSHHDALHNVWPGERHPPLELQQEWFGVKVKGQRKGAA